MNTTKPKQNSMYAQLRNLQATVGGLDRRTIAMKSRLDTIEPHAVEKKLNSITDDVEHLHDRLGVMIAKVTVATEVSFWARQKGEEVSNRINAAVIRAFDRPDEWWRNRDNKTIRELVEDLLADAA